MKRHTENLESRQEYLDKIDNKMFLSGMLDQEVSQSGHCQFSVIMVNSFAQVKWMKGKSLSNPLKIRFELFLRWTANKWWRLRRKVKWKRTNSFC